MARPKKRLGSFIAKTSRAPVVAGYSNIKAECISQQKVILETNKLVIDAVEAIKKHNDTSQPLTFKEVRDYISASSLSHLLDAWGYLANSVASLLNGNHGVAIHLGYYAELRAVMSLLASEGIGIFSTSHLGLNDNHKFSVSQKNYNNIQSTGTHVFAWEALDKWCKSSVKPSTDIVNIFSVKGHSFRELTEGFHPSASVLNVSAITKKWLLKWAFDVSKFRNDRELRNFVSYRPQSMMANNSISSFKEIINTIHSFFYILSPLESDTFHVLDRWLLKKLYLELFKKLKLSRNNNLEELIENAFNNLGDVFDNSLKRIVLGANEHPIFVAASQQTTDPIPIVARATLLLRVATGLVSRLLIDSGVQKQELNFVWNKYGFNNGFWKDEPAIDEFYKLWVDIEGDFADMIERLEEVNDSPFDIKLQFETELVTLGQFNRAVLWGI